MPGSENCPSEFDTVLETIPVPACLAATSAPGITAPDPSTTVPEIVWVDEPWAKANVPSPQKNAVSKTNRPTRNKLRFIGTPSFNSLRARHAPAVPHGAVFQ